MTRIKRVTRIDFYNGFIHVNPYNLRHLRSTYFILFNFFRGFRFRLTETRPQKPLPAVNDQSYSVDIARRV